MACRTRSGRRADGCDDEDDNDEYDPVDDDVLLKNADDDDDMNPARDASLPPRVPVLLGR